MPFFQTERRRAVEFIISEASHFRSRDVVTVEPAATPEEDTPLEPGTIVAAATASTVKPYAPDTLDLPLGIIMHRTARGAKVTAIVRDAEVNALTLAWPEAITEAQKDDAVAALGGRGIIVRG